MVSARWRAFALTFSSYAMFHAGRKTFSVIKPSLVEEEWVRGFGTIHERLGLLDTLFMFAYAVGLYASGWLTDHTNPRLTSAAGLAASAFLIATFSAAGLMGVHTLGAYAALWGLNGLVQSAGWPANVAVMGLWFPRSSGDRGGVFGLWTSNSSV